MKKTLIATLLIGMMGSCGETPKGKKISKSLYGYDSFEIVVVDSCEYLVALSNGHFQHKANCKNTFHKGDNK